MYKAFFFILIQIFWQKSGVSFITQVEILDHNVSVKSSNTWFNLDWFWCMQFFFNNYIQAKTVLTRKTTGTAENPARLQLLSPFCDM